MATTKFRASKRFHFSENGTDPWAVFEKVPDSDPPVYEFETSDAKAIAKLDDCADVEKVAERAPATKAPAKKAAAKKVAGGSASSSGDDTGNQGGSGDGENGSPGDPHATPGGDDSGAKGE
jgi:hypothetical protein